MLEKISKPTLPNAKSPFQTVEQEQAGRRQIVEGQLKSFRALLPGLLKRLSKIKDPRNPKTVKHKLMVVLLYGLYFILVPGVKPVAS
ncbi:MAG: hypothetical protein QHH10_01740 [Peptococcaceae bacterium]|jgi:hypothetical protein|nr:transposase family protein [Peptococcaceae bacterium]MDH7524018.1 hypothetical protein [Peptococcaceae bacterium]